MSSKHQPNFHNLPMRKQPKNPRTGCFGGTRSFLFSEHQINHMSLNGNRAFKQISLTAKQSQSPGNNTSICRSRSETSSSWDVMGAPQYPRAYIIYSNVPAKKGLYKETEYYLWGRSCPKFGLRSTYLRVVDLIVGGGFVGFNAFKFI